ncbi:MAG: methionyl-tRNA formyltransferase [Prevotella intermedia]
MDKKDMRIVFMGTPEFAVESLKALVEGGYNVVGVVTQPDKPVGRHQETLQPPAVKVYAESVGLPVLQPIKMKDAEFLEQLRALKADLQVVVAFRMLPEVVWSMPRFGTFNVHAALLPQYRGAAPINWAVINGETETGVTTFFLDKDIDTGRIIKRKYFPIPDNANVEYVYDGLMRLGAELAIETIDLLCEKVADDFDADKILSVMNEITEAQKESSDLRHAPKIFKETCEIDWHQKASAIYNFVRGLSPYPGAWSKMISLDHTAAPATKMVLKIFEVAKTEKAVVAKPGTFMVENKKVYVNTNDFLLELKELQLSGKKRMDSRSFLNGFKQVEEYRLEKE